MFVLPGYIIHEKIHENDRTKIYRGCITSGKVPVIIKVLKQKQLPGRYINFIYEYELTRNLKIEVLLNLLDWKHR